MKHIILAIALIAAAAPAAADEYVNGYYRHDGTYVAPHHRSSPDHNRANNYGAQGMTNPYTGQAGSLNPYAPQLPQPQTVPQAVNPYAPLYPLPATPSTSGSWYRR